MDGIYFPFIHFRSDAWLSSAALYWESMARIVPGASPPERDSETVKKLESIDFVRSIRPGKAANGISAGLADLLDEHGDSLQERYDLKYKETWEVNKYTERHAPEGSDPKLAYVHTEKMGWKVVNKLFELGLSNERVDGGWIGMHPHLADFYMTALTNELAGRGGPRPTADESVHLPAAGGQVLNRLAQGLLQKADLELPHQPAVETAGAMALIIFKSVVPAASTSIDQVIGLRKTLRDERHAFQVAVESLMASRLPAIPGDISYPKLVRHLKWVYDNDLAPHLDDLRTGMVAEGVQPVEAAYGIQGSSPGFLTSLLQGLGLLPDKPPDRQIELGAWDTLQGQDSHALRSYLVGLSGATLADEVKVARDRAEGFRRLAA